MSQNRIDHNQGELGSIDRHCKHWRKLLIKTVASGKRVTPNLQCLRIDYYKLLIGQNMNRHFWSLFLVVICKVLVKVILNKMFTKWKVNPSVIENAPIAIFKIVEAWDEASESWRFNLNSSCSQKYANIRKRISNLKIYLVLFQFKVNLCLIRKDNSFQLCL